MRVEAGRSDSWSEKSKGGAELAWDSTRGEWFFGGRNIEHVEKVAKLSAHHKAILPVNKQGILLGLVWIASLVAAYFVGGIGGASPLGGTLGEAATASPAAADAATKEDERVRDHKRKGIFEIPEGRPKTAMLIAKARLEFSRSSMEEVDFRLVLRALAPIADLDPVQIAEALGEVERTVQEPAQKMMFYFLLLDQWAETDGKAAVAYLDEKLGEKNPINREIRENVLAAWASRDPGAVWSWYETERKGDAGGHIMEQIFAGMAAHDLDAAWQRLEALDEASRGVALRGIASSATGGEDYRRLAEHAASLPQAEQAPWRKQVADSWAVTDAEGGIGWLRSLPPEEQKTLRDSAGRRALSSRPALGAEFLLEGAAEEEKPQIYVWVANEWANQNSRAAGEWLTRQPQGPELDGARQTFAYAVMGKDPAAAMDWAKSVQNEKRRAEAVEQIFQQWRAKDAVAAEAALGTVGLPQEQVQRLKDSKPPEKAGAAGSSGS